MARKKNSKPVGKPAIEKKPFKKKSKIAAKPVIEKKTSIKKSKSPVKPIIEKTPSKKAIKALKKPIKVIPGEQDKKKRKPKKRTSKGHLFHVVQHELSSYIKSKDVKLGRTFQSHASSIYRKVLEKSAEKSFKGSSKKFVKDNIEALFKKASSYSEEIPVETTIIKPKKYKAFAESINYWMATDEFVKPQYQDVTISLNSFDDGIIDFPLQDFPSGIAFADWFERNLKPHCRQYYNGGDYAVIRLISNNSDEGYLEYELQVGVKTIAPKTEPAPKKPEKPEPILPDVTQITPERPSSINKISEIQAKIDVLQKRKEALMRDIEFYEKRGKNERVTAAESEYESTDDKIKYLLNQMDSL